MLMTVITKYFKFRLRKALRQTCLVYYYISRKELLNCWIHQRDLTLFILAILAKHYLHDVNALITPLFVVVPFYDFVV